MYPVAARRGLSRTVGDGRFERERIYLLRQVPFSSIHSYNREGAPKVTRTATICWGLARADQFVPRARRAKCHPPRNLLDLFTWGRRGNRWEERVGSRACGSLVGLRERDMLWSCSSSVRGRRILGAGGGLARDGRDIDQSSQMSMFGVRRQLGDNERCSGELASKEHGQRTDACTCQRWRRKCVLKPE